MKTKFFNWDYFKGTLEEARLMRLCSLGIEKADSTNNKVLIIIPSLMGEFVATLPAIFDFYKRENKKIDLVVSSPLKTLAERVVGINNVYVAKSVAGRSNESHIKNNLISQPYEEVIIIKASRDVLYNIIPHIKAAKVSNKSNLIKKYVIFDVLKNTILRKEPMQWRDFAFHLFRGKSKNIDFKDILNFKEEEYKSAPHIDGINEKHKKIIIHTGGSWPMMRWDLDRWADLLKRIEKNGKYEFIFIGQEKEKKDYDYISSKVDFPIFSAISKVNSAELLLLMNSADYFIGIDSGPGNLAHLIGLRSIMIYGPGPHIYMPTDKNDVVIDKARGRGLYQQFFLKKNSFISQITVEEVFNAFCRLTSVIK